MLKNIRNQIFQSLHDLYCGELERFYCQAIPVGGRVLELGCGDGKLLAALHPDYGLGLDKNPEMIRKAQQAFSHNQNLEFQVRDVEQATWEGEEPFDYIVLSDITPLLTDIQDTLERLHPVCTADTRLVLNFHNNLWHPILYLASRIGLRNKYDNVNWLSMQDVTNLLKLSGFEEIIRETRILFPVDIPILTPILNRFLAKLPFFRHFCLTCFLIAREAPHIIREESRTEYTVSIVVPTRNERGNIEDIFKRTPQIGKWTELVFVDGHSTDGTLEEIHRCVEVYKKDWPRVQVITQDGTGKGQAMRQAFDQCHGEIFMILDSDLTMPPEDLPKYYRAIVRRTGEFINGSRLVYPMENQAMRFLNMLANKFFALLFSWLLSQPVKDTLCGTKVFRATDYRRIAENRSYFGDFDPFGDFDLLFGAARLNLRIVDLPIRYRDRTYGEIKIDRWAHGWLLIKMSFVAFRKLKLT